MWDLMLDRLERATARRALACWAAEVVEPVFVERSANAVFRFELEGRPHFLRMVHAALRDRPEVASALDYLRHLHAAGAPVCRPRPSAGGEWIERVEQGEDVFLASVVEGVAGETLLGRPPEPAPVRALGRALGRLHRAAESYAPSADRRFLRWDRNWQTNRDSLAADDGDARREAERIEAFLETLPRDAPFQGVTHADVNLGNVFWEGTQVMLIDFDEPVLHWYAADVARPFRDWLGLSRSERRRVLGDLLAGYREERALGPEWEAAIPWLFRMKELEIFAWASRRESWAGDTLPNGEDRRAHLAEIHRRFREPLEW